MKKNQRTEWIGLWYQGEGSGIYTSKHYKKKDFIDLLSQKAGIENSIKL